METKNIIIFVILIIVFCLILGTALFMTLPEKIEEKNEQEKESTANEIETGEKAQAIMILIEFQNTLGLSNFVNEMEKRDIKGLLMVTPEFVQENCTDIKEIIKHGVEIVGSHVAAPFWDMPS